MYRIQLLLGIVFFLGSASNSQCAMCRIVAESSQDAGGSIANGLNTGILYLMLFPYILILIGLISIYLQKAKEYN